MCNSGAKVCKTELKKKTEEEMYNRCIVNKLARAHGNVLPPPTMLHVGGGISIIALFEIHIDVKFNSK